MMKSLGGNGKRIETRYVKGELVPLTDYGPINKKGGGNLTVREC